MYSRNGGRQASGTCLEAMYVSAKRDCLILDHSTSVYDAMHAHAQALVLQRKRYIFRNRCSRTERVCDLSVDQCAISKWAGKSGSGSWRSGSETIVVRLA